MTDPAAPLVMHPALGGPGIYVTSDDALRLTTLNSVASVTIALTGRFLTPDGRRVQPFQERHVPNSDRTAATSDFPLADGWLANLSAIVTGAAPQFGQTFVRVDLIRGRGTAAVVLATLLQGFVTSAQRLAWPGSPIVAPIERAGAIRSILGSNPAAGAEILETVPTGARWRLLAMQFSLVTDATVANRRPVLVYDDGGSIFFRSQAATNATASTTITYTAAPFGGAPAPLGGDFQLLIPANVYLLAGFRVRTSSVGLVAGDDYSAPQLLVEEWLEGA